MCFEGYLPRFSRKSVPDIHIQCLTTHTLAPDPKNVNYILFVTAFWGTPKKKALANFFVSA